MASENNEFQTSLVVRNALDMGIAYAERFVSREYMSNLPDYDIIPFPVAVDKNGNRIDEYADIRLYRIAKLVLDKEENTTDKLASVYGAIHSINSTLMVVVKSTIDGVEFFLGTKNGDFADVSPTTAGQILKSTLKSNFPGSELIDAKTPEISTILKNVLQRRSEVATVSINPSLRDDDKEHFVQGFEKFLDAFSGKEYTAVLIAQPLDKYAVEEYKRGLEDLYSSLSHFSETTLAYGTSESKTVTENISRNFSEAINNSVSRSNGASQSHGSSSSRSNSWNSSSGYSGMFGNSSSGSGSSTTSGTTRTSGTNWSESATNGTTKSTGDQRGQSFGNTSSETKNITVTHTDKTVFRLLERIDEQLEKISLFESYGMWTSGAYFVSKYKQTSVAAANTFRALVLGDETRQEAFVNIWGTGNNNTPLLLQYVSAGRHPLIRIPEVNQFISQTVTPTSLVSGKELPISFGFPRTSLKGLIVNNVASFGRSVSNLNPSESNSKIRLGCVIHKGDKDERNSVELDIEEFTSHCFITGSTGSGKSNTTYHLLESIVKQGVNFLVIEPKKGEYKLEFGGLEGVNVFWTNTEKYSFLRINPFSFPKGIHVLEHMDRLIEIFGACWPLYNAMPAILKEATERSYVSCGWDLLNSRHFNIGKAKFPTFSDLLTQIPLVIKESDYSAQAKGDYSGALVTRVSSLTNGIMGQVFTSGCEIDDEVLFDQNTIIDLSRVGASETKSLIMGILVMKLNEYRISSNTAPNSNLKHITVIEEAHNLLRRVSMEQSGDSANVAGKSVEMISNSIAELRTYGEGFFIVDQSPTAVDVSAIKNTNTKIVMRLPDRNDIEVAGNAFSLNPEQINEIARLPRGVAIVSQSGWVEPILTGIDKSSGEYRDSNKSKNNLQGIALPFINAVLDQIDNQLFVDKKIKNLLREKEINPVQSDELFRIYRSFIEQPVDVISTPLQKAKFAVSVVGCIGLMEIYPIKKEGLDSFSQLLDILGEWRKMLYRALDEYAVFDSTDEKDFLIDSMLLIKADIERRKADIERRSGSKVIGVHQKAIIAGLLDLFPIKIESNKDDDYIYRTYRKWRDELCIFFDEYATFETIEDKKRIVDQLLYARAKTPGVYKNVYDAWVRRTEKVKKEKQE